MRKKILAILMTCAMLLTFCPIVFSDAFSAKASTSIPLYAGKTNQVGNVYVTNDGSKLTVNYVLSAEGWVFTELNLSVEKKLADIPKTITGNPVPGQFEFKESFTYDKKITSYKFEIPLTHLDAKAGDALYIAAHAVVQKKNIVVNATAPYGGSSVVDAKQGFRYDGSAVKAERSNPDNALHFEIGHSENYFYSLGFQQFDASNNPTTAYIIIKFDNPIINEDGPDLQIVEDTWGLPYPNEKAFVSVSNDGINWTYVGTADNQIPLDLYHTVSNFELPAGWISAMYVKVQDDSLKADFASLYPAQAATLDGFDLNAVLALHDNKTCTVDTETAWAYGKRFVQKGDWGMYFTYTLN